MFHLRFKYFQLKFIKKGALGSTKPCNCYQTGIPSCYHQNGSGETTKYSNITHPGSFKRKVKLNFWSVNYWIFNWNAKLAKRTTILSPKSSTIINCKRIIHAKLALQIKTCVLTEFSNNNLTFFHKILKKNTNLTRIILLISLSKVNFVKNQKIK